MLWKVGNKNIHKTLGEEHWGWGEESMYLQSRMFPIDMEFSCESEMRI